MLGAICGDIAGSRFEGRNIKQKNLIFLIFVAGLQMIQL